jgi:CHAT domain-containing protein
MPREHVDTLVNFANLSFGLRDWDQAARLYQQVAESSRTGFDPSLDRDILLYDAARSDRWFERAAFALAQLGRSVEAFEIADAGRARWLRQRVGFGQARPGSILDGLQEVLPERTVLLMPIVTSAGTVVLAVARADASVKAIYLTLTDLDGDTVAAFLKTAWLEPYGETFPDHAMRQTAPKDWNQSILLAGDWIGARFLSPVLSWLNHAGLWPADELILSVQGELALLPLHAATMLDGRRLLELARVSFLPAPSLLEYRSAASGPRKLLTLHDPAQEPALPYSAAEAALATRANGREPASILDKALFLQAFAGAEILHFVGHARFDLEEPQASSLRLANGEYVQVREIVAQQSGRAPDLVILSACETGRVETSTMANEYVGLPFAFMSAGAKGVISSLWPVSDGPTLFLMARVLQEIQTNAKPPAAALRDAQLWLSGSTGLELGRIIRDLKPELGSPVARFAQILSVEYRTKRPYAEPWAWAGFVYVGRQ